MQYLYVSTCENVNAIQYQHTICKSKLWLWEYKGINRKPTGPYEEGHNTEPYNHSVGSLCLAAGSFESTADHFVSGRTEMFRL